MKIITLKYKYLNSKGTISSQKGITIVLVAFLIFIFLGFAALAVDLGFAYVYRTRLQKAVDAAALAGARVLYSEDGKSISYTLADDNAQDVAKKNVADGIFTTKIGHWAFGMGDLQRGFHPYEGTGDPDPVDLTKASSEIELDGDESHINAVQVTAQGPSPSFFSRIWGKENISVSAQAVAYLGYAGTLDQYEADIPIVICADSIKWESEELSCGIGRLIHSGKGNDFNTGAWTNYSSGDCPNPTNKDESANNKDLQDIIDKASVSNQNGVIPFSYPQCKAPNSDPIIFGKGVYTIGGQLDNIFDKFAQCTRFYTQSNDPGNRDTFWNVTVLVVDCENNSNPGSKGGCLNVVGAVNLDIVLMTPSTANTKGAKAYEHVPSKMEDFVTSETGFDKWEKFVNHFDLKVLNPSTGNFESAIDNYFEKTIYALPSCKPVDPKGLSGGRAFGVMAKVPVLVK